MTLADEAIDNGTLRDYPAPGAPARSYDTLFPRVKALVEARKGEYADTTMRIPMSRYRDREVYTTEQVKVFDATPLPIAPTGALPEPGDYITRKLASGRPVIISRDEHGVAHVLLNVCRHRGATVATGSGCATKFACPYHGWTYGNDGHLTSLPGRPGFDDVDTGELGLFELSCAEGSGFIWCRQNPADANTPIDVAAHLGPMAALLEEYVDPNNRAAGVIEVPVEANWKCLMEAFYETYHFPFVHSDSMVGRGSIANIVSYDELGRHARLGVPRTMMRLDPPPPGIELVTQLFYVYPNLVIATSPFGVELIEGLPAGTPDRSFLRHTVYLNDMLQDVGREEYIKGIQTVIRDEDGPVMQASGHGIAAAAHDEVILGRNEIGCQHIHRHILEACE